MTLMLDEKEGADSLSLDTYGCDRDVVDAGAWVLLQEEVESLEHTC